MDRTAVVDSFSLYSIAAGHRPGGLPLRASAQTGNVSLVTSTVALAVACTMRSCWEDTCSQEHPPNTVEEFLALGGVSVVPMSPAEAVSAAALYRDCDSRRIGGAEVLAACHSVLLAKSRAAPLVSTPRALYCYVALGEAEQIEMI